MNQVVQKMCVGVCAVGFAVGMGVVGGCGGESETGASGGGASGADAKKPSFNPDAVKGALLYKATCATCHGEDAKGLVNNGTDLTASAFIKETSDADLLTYVIEGREVPGGVPMPPRGGFTEEMLPDGDIMKIIAFLRNMPGNQP